MGKTLLARTVARCIDAGIPAHPVSRPTCCPPTSPGSTSSISNAASSGSGRDRCSQHHPRRRDQPRHSAHPVLPAGGNGGASGHRGRPLAPPAPPLPGHRDPEPRSSRKAPSRCLKRSSTLSLITLFAWLSGPRRKRKRSSMRFHAVEPLEELGTRSSPAERAHAPMQQLVQAGEG